MDIKIEHNFDAFAKELEKLSSKQFKAIFKRSMTTSLKSGRKLSSQLLKKKVKAPRGSTYAGYFKTNSKVGFITGELDRFNGSITYGSKRHGHASYTTEGKLKSHRRNINKAGFNSKKLKKVKQLEFQFSPGKKTRVKGSFAAKKNGKWQVFRIRSSGKIGRASAQSLSQAMRSNRFIIESTKKRIVRSYNKDFSSRLKFRTDNVLKKARQAKLKA